MHSKESSANDGRDQPRSTISTGLSPREIAYRALCLSLLLAILGWEVARGLYADGDLARLRMSSQRASEHQIEAFKKLLATEKERDQLKWRLATVQEYENYAKSFSAARQMPSGQLGFPLGTYLKIEGKPWVNESQMPIKAAADRLVVERVNDRNLDQPITVTISNLAVQDRQGLRFVIKGYETIHTVGRPELPEYEGKPSPTASWGLITVFVVTTIEQPEGLILRDR